MSRLLVISRCSNPRGGADQIIADICRNLPEKGWDVYLGLTKGNRFNRPERYREVHPGLPIIEVDGTLGTQQSRVRAIRKVIVRTRPDVVLSMRVFDVFHAISTLKKPPRLAVGVRSFEAQYLGDVKRFRNIIDCCVTSGKLIRNACVEWAKMDSERVRSIAGGVRAPLHQKVPAPLGNRPLRIIYAGRLDNQQKRCLDIVQFVAEMKQRSIAFELDIAGTGPAEPELRELLASDTDAGNVRFHGWVEREELYQEHYPRADLFVHFAAWEGVTIAPREAMAHGVVPVISRFDGLQVEGQFIDGVNALTFPVGDVASAAGCVQKLVSDPMMFKSLSEAAKDSQAGAYSFDGAIQAWDDALRHCLMLPKCAGPIPPAVSELSGRLTKMGVPSGWQSFIRSVVNWKLVHNSPGSEWPTGSGLMTQAEQEQIEEFAELSK